MGRFSLLTLNSYGVPGISTAARLNRIAQALNEADYGVVCLQEVQSHRYRRLFQRACATCYPSQAYQDFVHAPKGGLLTLSRTPIISQEYRLFKERGLWYTPALMDWILHKGVLLIRTIIEKLPVVILNTHLTANYTGNWAKGRPFAMQEHRELMEIADLVNAQSRDALVIVAGDFNIPRGSWLYEDVLKVGNLTDPMTGDVRPTFRPHTGMAKRYAAPIDFTLYRAPRGINLQTTSDLQFQDKVLMPDRVPQYLSDHIAVETHFEW
jgi:endonuclease/exonuclease/phosphatase family metal-dependent hydrolase